MQMLRRASLLVLVSWALAACGGMTVNTDYDTEADFSSYHSFAWMAPPEDVSRVNQLVENRIKTAVVQEMEQRGFVLDEESPDIYITYMASVREKVDVSTTSYGYWRGSAIGDVDVYRYNEGTLVLDVIDRARNQLAWRGSGTGVIGSDAGSQEKITKAVHSILKYYPPR